MNNLKLTADYHTHTKRSDGHGTVEDNIKAAVEAGLKTIAITDHGPNHNMLTRCTYDKFLLTKQEIDNLKPKYPIDILFGIEANLVSLRGDIDITPVQEQMFDIIVLGTHKTPRGKTFKDFFTWKLRNFFKPSKKRIQKVTNAYLNAMRGHNIKILAHLNYVVKVDVKPIAELAAQKNIWIELNGKRVQFTQEEIDTILAAGANFVINSDAHRPEKVGKPDAVWEFLKTHHIPPSRIVNIQQIAEEN